MAAGLTTDLTADVAAGLTTDLTADVAADLTTDLTADVAAGLVPHERTRVSWVRHTTGVCVCVRACACVRACVRVLFVYVCARARACGRGARACVSACLRACAPLWLALRFWLCFGFGFRSSQLVKKLVKTGQKWSKGHNWYKRSKIVKIVKNW